MAILPQSATYQRSFLMVLLSDHVTGGTGLTVTVTISKNGGSFGAPSGGGTATEISSGWYYIALSATDTATLGDLAIHCTAATADPTNFCDQVVVANATATWQDLLSSSDFTTAGSVGAMVKSMANLQYTVPAIGRGTVTTGATTTSIPTSAFSPAGVDTNQFAGRVVLFDANTTTTNLRGEAATISASTSASTPTLTVSALSTAPISGDSFSVI